MQKPLNPPRAHATPAMAWARANLRFPPPAIPPKARLPAALGGASLVALGLFLVLFQWNWLRGPVAAIASAQLNRPVTIGGDLEVHPWSLSPWARANDVRVANAAWAGPAPLAVLPSLTLQIRLPALLRGKVLLPYVAADHPSVALVRDAEGRANWNFHEGRPPQPIRLPPIQHFVINDGAVRLNDAQRHLTFDGKVSSNERATGAGRGMFSLTGQGLLNGARFEAAVTGGPLLNVDATRPYPFDARITAGATRISARGVIPHPFDLGRFRAETHISGPDMSALYELTGIALPSTPPYDLTAGFGRAGRHFALRHIRGRVGISDLSGEAKVDASGARPYLSASLSSRRLDFADLLAVFGGVPRNTAGRPLSPAQQAMSAKLRAEHRMLPDSPLKIDRLRAMNADVSYRAQTVTSSVLPLRSMSAKVALKDSVLTFDPITIGLPQGVLSGHVRLDGRGAVPVTAIDLRLTGARLENLTPHGAGAPPIEGLLLARARLTGRGISVRAAAAAADGNVSIVVPRGQIRQAFAELLGINAAKGLFMLLDKDNSETPVRCAVADFRAQNGILTAQRIVLDTGVVVARGSGEVNLRDETVNLRLEGKSKKFRVVRVMAPITLKGPIASPKAGVDLGKAAPQLAIAGVLGAVLSPLAAVLPFVDPGLAKDADCGALLAEARAQGAPPTPKR